MEKVIHKIQKKITLENLMCLFVCLCPVLDMISFLFRNYFDTSFSPSTILRPMIPTIVFVVLFFKQNHKKEKILVASIYGIYAVIHLVLFQKLQNGSSYGNIVNEIQYLVNYSFMILNLYLFYTVIQEKEKLKKAVWISLTIYVISLFFSIITHTSSSTYLEGIGHKGYFESGNSLCTVLLLGMGIILGDINRKKRKEMFLIILIGIYLILFSGMRTGLFGFCLMMAIFFLGKLFIKIREKGKLTKKQIFFIILAVIVSMMLVIIIGSKTLERRKLLKQNEAKNIDQETQEQRYVTGDILNLYKQIKKDGLPENYMSAEEQNAIVRLCEYAKEIKLSNVNLRAQQFLYNVFLVKEQKNILLILFGNGYKNQTGELVMEMEIPALLCNFGFIGFLLYIGPFLSCFVYGIYRLLKQRKEVDMDFIMYLGGSGLAILLSTLSGYVYFNFSSMTMAILLNVFLMKNRSFSEKNLLP